MRGRGKSRVKSVDSASRGDDGKFELLLAHKPKGSSAVGSSMKARVIYYSCMFAVGLISTVACLWAMFYTSHSEEVASSLGLQRVANSLENIISLLAYPVLMFVVILTLYAGQQIRHLYKEANALTSKRP